MAKFDPISLARPGYGELSKACEPCGSPDADGLNLYVSNPAVVDLPVEGEITFRYKRGPATLTEASSRGPARASADFVLLEIVDVKAGESEETVSHEANQIDKFFEQARAEEVS